MKLFSLNVFFSPVSTVYAHLFHFAFSVDSVLSKGYLIINRIVWPPSR